LLAAFSIGRFLEFFKSFRTHLRTVERVMGVALVVTGVLFLTGGMQTFSYWLIEQFPGLASIG
jgi:cytochrome c-type biogenesis protein